MGRPIYIERDITAHRYAQRDIDRSAKRAHCELHSRHKVVLSMLVITSAHTTYLYMEYETPHSKTDLAEREREMMMMMMVVYALRAVVYARAWCACARARGGGGGVGGGGGAGASRRARGRRGGCRAS